MVVVLLAVVIISK